LSKKTSIDLLLILTICTVINFISGYLGKLSTPLLPLFLEDSSFARNFFMKFYMIIFSVAAMFVLGKGNISQYGFNMPVNFKWRSCLWRCSVLGFLVLIVFIAINILGVIITGKEPSGFPPDKLLNMIIFVWIWSSFSEEIFTRGLLQSYLQPYNKIKFRLRKIDLSLPVIISAFAFASMHLMLLTLGFTTFFVIGIFFNTLILGLVAGYYREKSESILPAIVIHILFNIIGSMPLVIKTIILS